MNFLSCLFSEKVVASILVILLICFVNPFNVWMTDALHMTILGGIVAVFAAFAVLLWKERAVDEREQLHRFIAARFAYIAGATLLLFGTVIQAFSHKIDPWIPSILASMVFAKIAGRFFARRQC